MANTIQHKRGTAAQWSSLNPLLASGELGLETDTHKFKFGDGVNYWNSLGYASDSTWGSIAGNINNQTDLINALGTKVSKTGDTMTGNLRMSNGALYLEGIGGSVSVSTGKLVLGTPSNQYAYLTGNSSGAFGIYSDMSGARAGICCYPTQAFFADTTTKTINLGRSNNVWKTGYIDILSNGAKSATVLNIINGATAGSTALQPDDNISKLYNDVGYITSATLPTVNNGTLNIQVNGTSIGTFTANQAGSTTADITIPDEVFLAQYGSTTAQEIAEALDADKIVMMIDDNKIYHLSSFNSSFFYFSCLNNQISNYIVFNGETWSRGVKTLENTANRVTSLSATSTDTQYPSAKCVYDELQSIASSIPTVGNGTITFTQGGVTKGTITTNQSGNATIDFDAGGSGSSAWGGITGTLSNQTDLQTALNAKVNKSGDTMTGQLRIERTTGSNFIEMKSGLVQRGTTPNSTVTLGFMEVSDKNGSWLGKNQCQYTNTGDLKMELSARSVTSDSTAKLSVGFDSSNRAFATAPATSTTRTNSTDIITRGFLNNQITTIQTEVNDKAEKDFSNCTKPYVTETYQNGDSWYRLYSDGWCEQGGATSTGDWTQVTFLKPFSNTNYTIIAGATEGDRNQWLTTSAINSKDTNGFWIGNYYNGTPFSYSMWYACGYTI